MTNIIIRSDEVNAAATALALSLAGHKVALRGKTLTPGDHSFQYLGHTRTTSLATIGNFVPTDHTVGVVFAEGESVTDGMEYVFRSHTPDLVAIVGGGLTAVAEAISTASAHNFNTAGILHIGSFIVNGTGTEVRAEKSNVLAGFMGFDTSPGLIDLATSIFPQISLGDGPTVALSSVNAFVHLPPMLLNAMNVERGVSLKLYVEGFGDSVCSLLEALDEDRIRLGKALGYDLTPVPALMERSRGPNGMPGKTLREKIHTFPAYQHIRLPSSLNHRYLEHELRSTFAPMNEVAHALGLQVPSISSVVRLGEILLRTDLGTAAKLAARTFIEHLGASSQPDHSQGKVH
ncbi:NAD/NADP octopine/nopaline dehydrogenase family protein [Paenarthrobacter sp. NPDC090522]|uniref:NAD/NADP octopine/nopaline dehydrogenase family protein n=1 Tax=Paenarthrobacter sp. NPDC090522 TaxID=3364383 RepID=UPI00380829C6